MKKTIYVKQGKKTRQAVYCPKCYNKKSAIKYLGDFAYADVPCRCRNSV